MPRGGYRPGAGRPPGPDTARARKARRAYQLLRRLNSAKEEDLPKIDGELAATSRAGKDVALREPLKIKELAKIYKRVGAVLNEEVPPDQATPVLRSAAMLADALVGPQAQEVKHTLADQHAAMALAFRDELLRELSASAASAPGDPASRALIEVPPRRRRGRKRKMGEFPWPQAQKERSDD